MLATTPLDEVFESRNKVRVLRHLVLYPSRVATVRSIARELDMNHATCTNVLDNLHRAGVVTRQSVGRSLIYSIDPESTLYRDLLFPLFSVEAGLLDKSLQALMAPLKGKVKRAYLFGSVARREDTNSSDVDVLLIINAKQSREKVEELAARGAQDAYRVLRKGFNVIVYSEKEFGAQLKTKGSLAETVRREGIPVRLEGTVG